MDRREALPSPGNRVDRTNDVSAAEVPERHLSCINISPSVDGCYVHFHFVTDDSQVSTVQLDKALAASFHARLGEVLLCLSTGLAGFGRLH